MTPPTRLQQLPCLICSETMDGATFDTAIDPKDFGGVVLRAANRNQLIAGGNHTIMDMTPPYESGTITCNLNFEEHIHRKFTPNDKFLRCHRR